MTSYKYANVYGGTMNRSQLLFGFGLAIFIAFFAQLETAHAAARSRGPSLGGDSALGFGLSFIGADQKI